MPKPPGQTVFELKVMLADVEPGVSRRLLVPGSITLGRLHDIFQVSMGWTNSHLHSFEIGAERYGPQYDEYPEGEIDEAEVSVLSAIGAHETFAYEYDFGDSWDHKIVVERVARLTRVLKHAVCLEGENACPPEDCGGSGGYRHLLKVLADPTNPEYRDLIDWVGGPFDPTHFDVAEVNVALQRLR